jgi:hypothetical protein
VGPELRELLFVRLVGVLWHQPKRPVM